MPSTLVASVDASTAMPPSISSPARPRESRVDAQADRRDHDVRVDEGPVVAMDRHHRTAADRAPTHARDRTRRHETHAERRPAGEQALRFVDRRPCGQWSRGRIEDGHGVSRVREVVGQFATDEAGTDHRDACRTAGQHGVQLRPRVERVDAPAEIARHRLRLDGPRAHREDQRVVAEAAARGADALARGVDRGDEGMRHQTHRQVVGDIGTERCDQVVRRLAVSERERQRGLRIDVGRVARDQRDRHVGIFRAQRPRDRPAGEPAADDHHALARAQPRRELHDRARRDRAGRRTVVGIEVLLRHAAQRTGPVVGDVVVARAGREPAVGIAVPFVVHVATGAADEPSPRRLVDDDLGEHGAHAGVTGVMSRAISFRRCLIAGVTIATKCDSRTRRCGAALIR